MTTNSQEVPINLIHKKSSEITPLNLLRVPGVYKLI